jgi:hypothetical protein
MKLYIEQSLRRSCENTQAPNMHTCNLVYIIFSCLKSNFMRNYWRKYFISYFLIITTITNVLE